MLVDDEPRFPSTLEVWPTLGEARRVYRLLFRRSVATAAVVYAAIALVEIAHHVVAAPVSQALGFVEFLATFAGPVIVQGALVEIVRNIHEGRPPERIGALFKAGGNRFWSLLGASVLYSLGIIFGAILLLIPGLIVAARWCLLAPLIMLEHCGVIAASRRSSTLVQGHTGTALGCIAVSFLISGGPSWVLLLTNAAFSARIGVFLVWNALTAPFSAHVLTVIYYRLADSDKPVIDPAVHTWRSVWEGR